MKKNRARAVTVQNARNVAADHLLTDLSWLETFPDGQDVPSEVVTCRDLIHRYTGIELSERKALRALKEIKSLHVTFQRCLGRSCDLRVAMLDYFTSHNRRLRSPRVVESAAYETQLERATRDPLTGLYNRHTVADALRRETVRSRRIGVEYALALIDLDDFKSINDVHGHAVGDEVLRGVAQLMIDSLRGEDIAARYGGEEFLILMPGTGSAEAALVLHRLQAAVRQLSVVPAITCTFSAGIAMFPQHGTEPEALIALADRCMYQAKRSGKDRIIVPDEKRRTTPRFPLRLPVAVMTPDEVAAYAVTVDISATGLSLTARVALPVGSAVRMVLRNPEDDSEYEVISRVVWTRRSDKRDEVQCGVAFRDDYSALVGEIMRSA